MRKWYDTLYNFLALASRRRSKGLCPSQKTPRQRARQFYERARQAVRYGALSTRVARSLLRRKSAFRRNAQQASQFYKSCELWFTSSTWGGWWFATLLLVVVFGGGAIYLHFIPKDAVTLQHLQFYAVIVIGLGSLYIAGTSFWAKRGSAFFVEYQTAKDMNTPEFIPSSMLSEEIIGNPANSTMPYVKRIYIRNEKNKHEAIKRILLQLPNKQTILLREYKKAHALLLIKPYEDAMLELNAATAYCRRCDVISVGEEMRFFSKTLMLIKNEKTIERGEIIIETVRGQSYIKSNKNSFVFYDEEKLLMPLFAIIRRDDINRTVLNVDVLFVHEIAMKENFINDYIFYNELMMQINSQKIFLGKFDAREGTIKIQITLCANKKASLCYSFQTNKKTYTFPVQEKLRKEFFDAYNKNNYQSLKHEDFINEFIAFCIIWAREKWGESKSNIYDSYDFTDNSFSTINFGIKTIGDEEP